MERRGKVELFEQIRREYEFGVGTVKEGRAQAGSRSPVGAPGLGRGPAARAQAELTRAASFTITSAATPASLEKPWQAAKAR